MRTNPISLLTAVAIEAKDLECVREFMLNHPTPYSVSTGTTRCTRQQLTSVVCSVVVHVVQRQEDRLRLSATSTLLAVVREHLFLDLLSIVPQVLKLTCVRLRAWSVMGSVVFLLAFLAHGSDSVLTLCLLSELGNVFGVTALSARLSSHALSVSVFVYKLRTNPSRHSICRPQQRHRRPVVHESGPEFHRPTLPLGEEHYLP